MRKALTGFYLVSACWLLFSCAQSDPEGIPVITLSADAESQVLDISELITIEKVIALETTDSNYLSQAASFVHAGEYILAIDFNDGIHQYSSEGKFVRFLVTGGRGPNEYYAIKAFDVDTANHIFYYSHFGDTFKSISAVDMKSGNPQKKIAFPFDKLGDIEPEAVRLSTFLRVNDHTFLIAMDLIPGLENQLFLMSANGDFSSRVPGDISNNGYLMRRVGTEVHLVKPIYNRSPPAVDNDTIFSLLENGEVDPVVIFNLSHRAINANEALQWGPRLEGPTKVFSSYSISRGDNPERAVFLSDKSNGESSIVSGWQIGYLGDFELNAINISTIKDDRVVISIDAVEFRQQAQEILKGNDLDAEVRQRLEDLMNTVTENSNPIVLLGRLK